MKPWYKVIVPREDLREGKPLDASEFAIHLDQIRDGRANDDYQKPVRFFERTYLTKNLREMTAEVLRRLSGIKVETSPVFNMSTQFGGGKTHTLTLLYHLVKNGSKAKSWPGVQGLLEYAGINEIPNAATAVFVGTEFDSIEGRGGNDGTPNRKTPWAEIAFQLSGVEGFKVGRNSHRGGSDDGGVLGLTQRRKGAKRMTENEIAKAIVDAAYKVHKTLGPGLLESVYERVLAHEIGKRGMEVKTLVPVTIRYDSIVFDEAFRADLVVEDKVIVELKSVENVQPVHKKQLLTYLRLSDKRLGLLINFGAALLKDGIARVGNKL